MSEVKTLIYLLISFNSTLELLDFNWFSPVLAEQIQRAEQKAAAPWLLHHPARDQGHRPREGGDQERQWGELLIPKAELFQPKSPKSCSQLILGMRWLLFTHLQQFLGVFFPSFCSISLCVAFKTHMWPLLLLTDKLQEEVCERERQIQLFCHAGASWGETCHGSG